MKKTLILGLIAMMALVANAQDQKKCCDKAKKCNKKADAQTGATKQEGKK